MQVIRIKTGYNFTFRFVERIYPKISENVNLKKLKNAIQFEILKSSINQFTKNK